MGSTEFGDRVARAQRSVDAFAGARGWRSCPSMSAASAALIEYVIVRVRYSGRKKQTMESDLTQVRQQAHALLDLLPVEKLNAVRSLLEVMVEPLSRSLAQASVDEEEITPETAAALDRARAALARGEGISHEQMRREFGLSK